MNPDRAMRGRDRSYEHLHSTTSQVSAIATPYMTMSPSSVSDSRSESTPTSPMSGSPQPWLHVMRALSLSLQQTAPAASNDSPVSARPSSPSIRQVYALSPTPGSACFPPQPQAHQPLDPFVSRTRSPSQSFPHGGSFPPHHARQQQQYRHEQQQQQQQYQQNQYQYPTTPPSIHARAHSSPHPYPFGYRDAYGAPYHNPPYQSPPSHYYGTEDHHSLGPTSAPPRATHSWDLRDYHGSAPYSANTQTIPQQTAFNYRRFTDPPPPHCNYDPAFHWRDNGLATPHPARLPPPPSEPIQPYGSARQASKRQLSHSINHEPLPLPLPPSEDHRDRLTGRTALPASHHRRHSYPASDTMPQHQQHQHQQQPDPSSPWSAPARIEGVSSVRTDTHCTAERSNCCCCSTTTITTTIANNSSRWDPQRHEERTQSIPISSLLHSTPSSPSLSPSTWPEDVPSAHHAGEETLLDSMMQKPCQEQEQQRHQQLRKKQKQSQPPVSSVSSVSSLHYARIHNKTENKSRSRTSSTSANARPQGRKPSRSRLRPTAKAVPTTTATTDSLDDELVVNNDKCGHSAPPAAARERRRSRQQTPSSAQQPSLSSPSTPDMSVAAASPPSSAGGDVHPRPPKEQGRQPTRQIRRNGKKKHVELPEEGPGEDIREEEEARTSSEEEEHEPNVHSRSTQDLANGEGSSKQPTREPTTTNRGLRLTKTGKIQHKWKKAGVARRSTAYNRYLQQQSRLLKEKYPHLSPQERMKMIAEAWPTSEKNPHKSRRRSPYLVAALEREAQAAAAAAAATRLSPIRENSPSGAQPESLPTAVATLWELDSPSASPSRVEIRSMTKHFPPPEPSREE